VYPTLWSGDILTEKSDRSSKNPFVETTVRYVLSYLSATRSFAPSPLPSAVITIYADNDYYSQPAAGAVPRFNALNVPLASAHKTGLGSSAALTTSLAACLLSTYSDGAPPSETQLHNLAQAAHCAAQGKVGSGFDVAAAVFGSCVYHRFSPAILEAVDGGDAARLAAVVDKPWDLRVRKTRVPPGLRLLMGDVDCGSSTPGMVRAVRGWRKENAAQAKAEWDAIQALNKGLIGLLADAERRAEVAPAEYLQALNEISSGDGDGAGTVSESSTLLRNIAEQIAVIREKIRAVGVAAGVPIEPEEQTRLLDSAVKATKGVLGGVVPGAGGYDAVAFLMADREDTVESLKAYLKGYEFRREDGGRGTVVALETREEHEGIRKEDIAAYGQQ